MTAEASRGEVFDLGYQAYDGPRLGRRGAVRAVVKDGLRRVLGLRRRARSKILPWSLLVIALLPAIVFLGIGVFAGNVVEGEIFGQAEYFDLTSRVAVIFIALASGEMLIPDRTAGTLQLYASRPLLMTDYLGARAGALASLVFGFLFLPQVLLWIGQASISTDGFLSYAGAHLGDLWRSGVVSTVFIVAYVPPAFVVASLATRTSLSAGMFVGGLFASAPLTALLVDQQGSDLFGLLALDHHPRYLRDWVFDASTRTDGWIPERAGLDPWVSLMVIVFIALAATALVVWRYRRVS